MSLDFSTPDPPLIVEYGDVRTNGYRRFTDGSIRAVRVDDQGHQYVLDDGGEPVPGTWLQLPFRTVETDHESTVPDGDRLKVCPRGVQPRERNVALFVHVAIPKGRLN